MLRCRRYLSSVTNLTIDDYLRRILTAQVYDVAVETTLQPALALSDKLNNEVLLKREDSQPVFSFKLRGAFNKMVRLPANSRVITCSAGNHAQGVALAARTLGLDSVIVMPSATPSIKVAAVRRLGATVVMHGADFAEAKNHALDLMVQENRELIHPYDDPYVIAGQGTIGMEICNHRNARPLDIVFCAVGGGGLIAGVAAYIKSIRPGCLIIGVEAEDADAMTQSLAAGKRVCLPTVGLFADGAAVREVGEETFRLSQQLVDGMITVSTDAICEAIRDAFVETRSILEPAGALSIAGMKKYVEDTGITGATLVSVCSGANMNFERLRFVADRCNQHEALISVLIAERPKSFWDLYSKIHPRNVTGFSYRYSSPTRAYVIASFIAESDDDVTNTVNDINSCDMDAIDLSHNEMAKSHVRHMVGGRSPGVENELLYRFEFRAAPGAMHSFLSKLSGPWNVSLWHYRSHGADISRVLVGLQVPHEERAEFKKFIDTLGCRYFDETDNIAFHHFLT